MKAEIEKVKKRREERAIEKAQHEEEMVSVYYIILDLSCLSKKTCGLQLIFLGVLCHNCM